MKRFFCVLLLLISPLVWAHHPGHVASGTRLTHYQGLKTKPASRAYFAYDLSVLDSSVGELHSFIVGGEWAFHKRISALLTLPIISLRHNYTSNATGLGDISLGGRFLLGENEKFFSFASLYFDLPTGSDDDGLGRGALGTRLEVLGGMNIGEWSLFLSPGVGFGWDTPHEPVVIVAVGATSPKIADKVYFSLGLSNQIFATSDVFKNGSFKTFIEPQINWVVDEKEKLTLSLQARASVIDQLERKSSVTLNNTSSSLLNDVQWGMGLGASYQF